MQQNGTAIGSAEAVTAARQLGPYIVGSGLLIAFVLWMLYRQIVPHMIASARAREEWVQKEVERAQERLNQAYDKIPAALALIAERMEEANRLNREAFDKLFTENARILERLPPR